MKVTTQLHPVKSLHPPPPCHNAMYRHNFTFMERIFRGSLINTHEFPQSCITACQEVIYQGFNLLQKDVFRSLRHSGMITEQPLQTVLRLHRRNCCFVGIGIKFLPYEKWYKIMCLSQRPCQYTECINMEPTNSHAILFLLLLALQSLLELKPLLSCN